MALTLRLRLRTKLWLLTAAVLCAIACVDALVAYATIDARVREELTEQARELRDVLMATRRVLRADRGDGETEAETETAYAALPIHALARLAPEVAVRADSGLSFGIVPDRPLHPSSLADAGERAAIDWLRAHPAATEYVAVPSGAEAQFAYAAALRMDAAACRRCHAASVPAAPGGLYGILSVRAPLAAVRAREFDEWGRNFAGRTLAYLGLLGLLGLALDRGFSRRLARLERAAQALAAGDYTVRAQAHGHDELAALGSAFDAMAAAVQARAAEREAALAQQRYLFARSPMPMLVFDRETLAILDANEAALAHYGYGRAGFLALTIADIRPPEDLPILHRLRAEVAAAGESPAAHTVRHRRRDGTLLDVNVWTRSLDYAGRPARLALIQDVTEQRRTDTALKLSELKYQTIFRTSPDLIAITERATGRFLEVNDAYTRIMGYTQQEAVGRTSAELGTWGAPESRAQMLAALGDGGRLMNFQTLFRRKDGEVFPALLSLEAARIGDQDCFIISARDIAERIAAERALADSEARFHTMIDWTYNWEYWLHADGSLHCTSPSVERITGYPADAFHADPALLHAIVHPDDRAHWDGHLAAERAGSGGILELRLRLRTRSGETRWVAHTCRPVTEADGRDCGRRVTVRDITAEKAAADEIRALAFYDTLTHLPNRRLLLDRVQRALAASRRSGEFGALLMLDLDHFKKLNDTQGHDVGDRLLVEVAQRLRGCIRQHETVARLGGDEFVVLLEGLGGTDAEAVAHAGRAVDKIRAVLGAPYALGAGPAAFHSTPSLGVTLYSGDAVPVDGLLKQADVALYQAKDAGRNTVRYFAPAMQAAIERRMQLEAALRGGLERAEFRLWYQPQVAADGRLLGAEALLRWFPDGAMVAPGEFIGLAEETGLIVPIGQWVLDAACAQLRAWQDAPATRGCCIAVNVSARQFHEPDFVGRVRRSVQASGIDPRGLKLELTESVVLDHVDEVVGRMHALRALGVGFSLDDFGTGYSSLSYLRRLPLDQLKIDQSFVRGIAEHAEDAAIVAAIVAMCRSLDLAVIAEGVETAAQRDALLALGCTAFQGWLYGRPAPIGDWPPLAATTD